MSHSAIELITKVLPDIFNAAASDMKAGDADAKARHAELVAQTGAIRIKLEGKGGKDVYWVVKDGQMRALDQAGGAPVLMALALPLEAVKVGLEELGDELEKALPKLQKRITRLSASRAKALFDRLAGENLRFHHVLKDTPDFDEVRVKIAIGDAEPPEKPTFTVELDYDSFEELRTRKLKPQALMGRLVITGDASRAMQLGMELMQRRG